MEIQQLLEKSSRDHSHLCPRQVLGVRLGLAGMKAVGFDAPPAQKRLVTIAETDGCFVDGVSAATGCTVGHRTLRIEDYGKTAAVFINILTGQAFRAAPLPGIREKACLYAATEPRHYFAQMLAYQIMPDDEMFSITPIYMKQSVESIISRPGVRVNCQVCGEEIMNEREIRQNGLVMCRSCAHGGYYQLAEDAIPWSYRLTGDVVR